ncbi:MAG: carboxylating nicotinate-nucleotide diphosphorylase [Betaproteobacteria bacterium]|nr:carboxylating nicotinate-nucleotide diphosphorylase [Betaproteobacteria bacterium]
MSPLDIDPALRADITRAVAQALLEDGAAQDWTARLLPDELGQARIVCRDRAVICGQAWVNEVFAQLDARVRVSWQCAEGDEVQPGAVVYTLHGPVRALVTGERAALNVLQTLSAIATKTRAYAQLVQGTRARVLDTRKTIPGLRLASKYAVRVGGGANQRINLADGILIKENHIAAAGGVAQALDAARVQAAEAARAMQAEVPIQIEVETLVQLREALTHGATSVLLDNFSLALMREAVQLCEAYAAQHGSPRAVLEASGGIDLHTLRAIAETGVDRISVGSLTKDIDAVDFSMRLSRG